MTYTKDSIVFVPVSTHPLFKNLNGQTFGRLTVLGYAGKVGKHSKWYCECECGTITAPYSNMLISGQTQSCDCLRKERQAIARQKMRTFDKPYLKERDSYTRARERCTDPTNIAYHRYGGRGIEFRFTSFRQFLGHIGERPEGHTLDRKDNDGHYEIGNVRWATHSEQGRNKSNNRYFEMDGESHILAEWCEIYACSIGRVTARVYGYGWCLPCALTLPLFHSCPHKTKN